LRQVYVGEIPCTLALVAVFNMASPQLENGYTKIANEIIDNIIRYPEIMRGALFPVICVVWRKTYGWNKKEDAISISQFVEMTGYSKRTIIYALQELEAKNVLKIKRECHSLLKETNIISFNKNYKDWVVQNSAPQVEKNRGSAKLRKKVVQNHAQKVESFAHTKETITKEITKDISEHSSPKSMENLIPEVIKLFEEVDPKNKTYYVNKTQRGACSFLLEEYGFEEIKKRVEVLPKTNGMPFFPNITTPVQLRDKWVQLDGQIKRYQSENINKSNLVAF